MGVCRAVAPHEYGAARAIIERVYQNEGYADDGTIWRAVRAHRDAATFGLYEFGEIYGTLSVVPDGIRGLPMDCSYRKELEPWRLGGKLAEAVQFAIDKDLYRELTGRQCSLFLAMLLFREVLGYAIEHRIAYLAMCVNPKHATFFESLGFEMMMTERAYPRVNSLSVAGVLYIPRERAYAAVQSNVNLMRAEAR